MANNHKLRRFRKVAARRQRHRCHYCDVPMWSKNPIQFAELHGLRVEDAGHFQCTAEHVVARRDGGLEHKNVVAACRYCNITRHEADAPLAADLYREQVQRDTRWLTRRLITP